VATTQAARGQEPQWLEAARALGIVFEEIAVVIAVRQKVLRHRLVAAGRDPGGAKIAPADMGRDGHVGGLRFKRLVDGAGIGFLEMVDIKAAIARLLEFDVRAQIRPGGVVKLQVAAPGLIEGAHRILIGGAEIVEDGVAVRIEILADRAGLQAEMQDAGARDGHLRRHFGVRLEEAEVLQHRMAGKPDLANDADAPRLGLDALELDAVIEFVDLDPVQHAVEVEVPPRAAIFPVGRKLEAQFLLPGDDLCNLRVFHRLEIARRDLALLTFLARLLERRRAQDRANMVGAEGRFCSCSHGRISPGDVLKRSFHY
jgi:hypothetical protein